jgi:hypothetical protein
MSLDALLERADIWRGGRHALRERTSPSGLSSGIEALDSELPGGGWPLGALTELLSDRHGIGEIALLLPALAGLSRAGRWIAWVSPPYLPYAPALAAAGLDLTRVLIVQARGVDDALWALEQLLRSGVCGAALAWPATIDTRRLRRLQLAAETGGAMGMMFRPLAAERESTPSALRLRLEPAEDALIAHILKCRGAPSRHPLHLRPQGRPCCG